MTVFDEVATRPVWLTTLADLGLLLVGFFVFVQASQHLDPAELSAGIREGFGIKTDRPIAEAEAEAEAAEPAMIVDLGSIEGFASGSAIPSGDIAAAIRWSRGAAADPRTRIRIAAGTDGSKGDVDPTTGSAAVLAADRARAVAVALVKGGAIEPNRIEIAGAEYAPRARRVLLHVGFAGDPNQSELRR